MKKFLQFSGLIAAVFAIVSIILLMACPSITYTIAGNAYSYSGIFGIFGGKITASLGSLTGEIGEIKATATAVIAFILLIAGIVILLLGAILPLLKVTALNKFSGLLNLIAIVCLIVAGVLVFFEVPAFCAAQSTDKVTWDPSNYHLGAGWTVSGILSIVAGVLALAPACANFLAKGKKKRR